MQVTKKNLSDTKLQLALVADAKQLQSAKKDALDKLSADLRLPGFRQGKAPAALVEKNINPATLQTEFLDRAVNLMYVTALQQENMRPVAQPEVKIGKFVPFDTLEITIEVEVVGEIKLPDYKKMKRAKKVVPVTAKDVDAVIDQLKKREAERKEADRPAKDGDQVYIDFAGVDAKTKEPIQGADGKDYPLILGSKTFIPGFEENLIGLKTGDEKTFTLTFPKDYGVKTLQNAKVEFAIKVVKIQEIIELKLDDAFAAKVGPFKTVAELKADVKKQIESERDQEADRAFVDQLVMDIANKTTVAIPAALIDEQLDRIVAEQKQNLMYRGQTWQEFLDGQGVTEEEYLATLRGDAELRVKAGLVLGEIADKEKIDVSIEELDIRMQLLSGQYPDKQMQEELKKPEARREIASRMVSEKTVDKLVGYATAK
ncbi:MAG: trigger factor [Candidatus Saccharimonadales bacterium]